MITQNFNEDDFRLTARCRYELRLAECFFQAQKITEKTHAPKCFCCLAMSPLLICSFEFSKHIILFPIRISKYAICFARAVSVHEKENSSHRTRDGEVRNRADFFSSEWEQVGISMRFLLLSGSV